jgi:hypothetical protein
VEGPVLAQSEMHVQGVLTAHSLRSLRGLVVEDYKGDPNRLKSVSSSEAFVLFYDYGNGNWSGLGADTGGNTWIRAGTSNTNCVVLVLGNHGLKSTHALVK